MKLTRWLCLIPLLAGCVMVEVGVRNPVPGLTTIAVVPFFNLSEERAVDGRRFAQAYFAELQKTPGFQVVPVGVTEQAIRDNRLEMSSPADAVRLAEILGVDAVVVGAVTDYSPYYPPRVGLQVAWYSPREWEFSPGIPTQEWSHHDSKSLWKPVRPRRGGRGETWIEMPGGAAAPCPSGDCQPVPPPSTVRGQSPSGEMRDSGPIPFGTAEPLMTYTRLFDGADPRLVARLRDYVELSGDLRSGGWEAYLHRSEDFIRFTSHVMIVEMLQLHGGEARHRVVLKPRRYK